MVIEYYVDDESFCIFTGHTVDLVQTTVGQEEDVWLSAGIDKFCFAKGELTPYERINPGFYSGRVLYLLVDAKSASFCVGSDYSMDLVVSVVVEGDWYNFERLGYLHYCAGEENIEEQFLEMFTPQGEDI